MKKYRKTIYVDVKAKLFEESDVEGYTERRYDDEDIQEDGTISTSGISGEHVLKIAHVLSCQYPVMSHYQEFKKEYLVIHSDGTKELIEKELFERQFKPI